VDRHPASTARIAPSATTSMGTRIWARRGFLAHTLGETNTVTSLIQQLPKISNGLIPLVDS
jgi:hypothetical protein